MRGIAIGLLAPCALLLTACPTSDDPDDMEVPPAAEQVQLSEVEGSGTTGELAVTPRDNETHMVVMLTNAPVDESLDVKLHSGTCANPGPEISNIGTIRTGSDGRGAIDTTVGEEPARIMDGNHIAVVWASLDRDRRDPMEPGTMDDRRDADRVTTDTLPDADRTDDHRQHTGLIRDDRRAIACSVLPRM
jgi:hypothetical protein